MSNDSTRARIVDTAGPIFAERGYDAATVREICDKAGVNLAAVNYYFGGKERLYLETLQRAHAAHGRDDGPRDWPPGTPPEEKLRHFIRQLLSHLLSLTEEPWEVRLMMREILNPTAAGRKMLREHFQKGFRQLQEILDEVLPADMPAHKRHQIALSIVGQCVYYRGAGKIIPLLIGEAELKRHFGIDQLAEHISEVSLAALGLGPPLAGPARRSNGRARKHLAGKVSLAR
jgi:TetR/AcrR family transcriptional regulator, regulator of cefoperazone and chloramphenicol sensitivity